MWLLATAPATARTLMSSTTAVSVTITTHPPTVSRSTTAKFGWKATGTRLTVSCRLGAGVYSNCSQPRSYRNLNQGSHSFTVRATGGGTTRTAVYRWTVDTVVPTAPSVTGGSTTWTNSTVVMSATGSTDTGGSGLASYQHRTTIDGGAHWSTPATGSALTVATTGTTWVQFRALDMAGNSSSWAPVTADPTATAMVDKLLPTVPGVIDPAQPWSAAASTTAAPDPSQLSTDSGGSGLGPYESRASSDGGITWSAAAAGGSAIVSAEGITLVEFRSSDNALNHSAWSAPIHVGLDRTAPLVTIAGGSASWTNAASVPITATPTDAGSGVNAATLVYRTSADGTTWSSPTAGTPPPISTSGKTYVEFQVTDNVGNTSAWPGSAPPLGLVQIDRTLPSAPAVSGGSLAFTTGSTTLGAAGSTDVGGAGLSSYVYRTSTDGGVTWSGTMPTPATVSTDGTTIVQMAAVDNAGNQSSWAPLTAGAASTVKLDNTPPSLPGISGGSGAWQKIASVTVTASGSADAVGGSGFNHYDSRTSADGGATWTAAASGATASVSAEGTTLVEFRAVDAVGNASAWTAPTANSTVKLDRVPPTVTAAGGSAGWQELSSVVITPAAVETGSGVNASTYQSRTSTDAGPWVVHTGSTATISVEGDTLVQFQVTDNAGNTSSWSGSAEVRLDRTAPTVPVPTGGSPTWTNASPLTIDATGSSTDAGSGMGATPYRYRTSGNGGTTWSIAANGSSVDIAAQGTTLVEFRAVDALGTQSAWSPIQAGGTAKIDWTAPTAPTVSGGSSAWRTATSTTISATGSTDSGGSGFAFYEYETARPQDPGTWSAPAPGSSVVVSAEGTTLVRFFAVDRAGNWSPPGPTNTTSSSMAQLDRTAPPAPTVTFTAGCPAGSSPNVVSAYADDGHYGSGAAYYNYSLNGGVTKQTNVLGQVNLTQPGRYTIKYQAVDNAGLVSAWTPTSTICVS